MKKQTKPQKQLLLSTEKVRELDVLTDDKLRGVVGGMSCDGTLCGSTRATSGA